MKIIYKTGDLLACEEKIIMHGCNAQGVMGAGIAKGIKSLYPQAFKEYRKTFETKGLKVGEVIWIVSGDKLVGNAITQEYYGRQPGKIYCSYGAIRKCMAHANILVSQPPHAGIYGTTIAMPKIGAGLAGGDWEEISAIIEEESIDFQPIVYMWNGDERGGK